MGRKGQGYRDEEGYRSDEDEDSVGAYNPGTDWHDIICFPTVGGNAPKETRPQIEPRTMHSQQHVSMHRQQHVLMHTQQRAVVDYAYADEEADPTRAELDLRSAVGDEGVCCGCSSGKRRCIGIALLAIAAVMSVGLMIGAGKITVPYVSEKLGKLMGFDPPENADGGDISEGESYLLVDHTSSVPSDESAGEADEPVRRARRLDQRLRKRRGSRRRLQK